LFLSLRKTRFFGFDKDNSNLKTKKKKTDFFLSFALFFLAGKKEALLKLRGLVLKPRVYN
jgi:hypothetical protein